MKRLVLLTYFLSWQVFANAAEITPEEVMAHVQTKGAQSAREAYFSCWCREKAVGYDLIETGSEKWLQIAVILVSDSDGCYAQALQNSIALAQINNPEKVLTLVDTGKRLEAPYICVPYMTDETDPKKIRENFGILDRMESALRKVDNPKLQTKKSKCLEYIESYKQDMSEALLNQQK